MKTLHQAITMAAATTLLVGTCSFADEKPGDAKPVEKTVAFFIKADNRYVSAAPKVGLNTKGSKIAGNQTFVLSDLNGGELADGDSIQIKWVPSTAKPTYWYEAEGRIGRIGGKPKEVSEFKIKLKEKSGEAAPQRVVLQTASGKFVSVPEKGAALATTDVEDKAATLDIMDVPKPETTETPKATE